MAFRYVVDHTNISSEDFDGETVCVNFATGTYFGLGGVAGPILAFFASPRTEDEALDFVARQYGVEVARVREEVKPFIGELIGQKLLIADDGEATQEEEPRAMENLPGYEPPRLEIHTDLQELIMLDPVHEADPEHGWPLRRTDMDD